MKRTGFILAGVVVLVLVLGGAAYVGGQLLNGQGFTLPGGAGNSSGPNGHVERMIQIAPAAQLQSLGAPLFKVGAFVRRDGNSIFVGTGSVITHVEAQRGGGASVTTSYDGPIVEIVVTHDTKLYSDVTTKQFNGEPPAGQMIQQVLEPGTLAEIGQNSIVSVWGNRTGERAVASVLVYAVPDILSAP